MRDVEDLSSAIVQVQHTKNYKIIHHFGKVLRGFLQKVHRIEWTAL
jgi:hypothetical protein